jgi:ribosomal protein S18 acetylase RimI-like enzyme
VIAGPVELRRLRAGEGARFRELRLRALQDSPEAFGSCYARELELDEDSWQRFAEGSERALTEIVFVAEEDGAWLGMAGGYIHEDDPTAAGLWGMWVAPEVRRRALGSHLADAVAAWARARRALRLELSVTDRSEAAAALYERLGFTPTGEREPLASDPEVVKIGLGRVL